MHWHCCIYGQAWWIHLQVQFKDIYKPLVTNWIDITFGPWHTWHQGVALVCNKWMLCTINTLHHDNNIMFQTILETSHFQVSHHDIIEAWMRVCQLSCSHCLIVGYGMRFCTTAYWRGMVYAIIITKQSLFFRSQMP